MDDAAAALKADGPAEANALNAPPVKDVVVGVDAGAGAGAAVGVDVEPKLDCPNADCPNAGFPKDDCPKPL